MSAVIVQCDDMEGGEKIWFPREFEAEQATYGSDCCKVIPVADDYSGPKWFGEEL